jgi:hypothetical protein
MHEAIANSRRGGGTAEESSSSFPLLDRKIESATAGLPKRYERLLRERTGNEKNSITIAEYIISMQTEINPSDNYRMNNIATLSKLSSFFCKDIGNKKREDISGYDTR